MPTLDLIYVLDVLNAMSDVEVALRDLYKACAEKWPSNAAFWNEISEAEDRHSLNMIRMTGIVSSKHEKFSLNRPSNEVAIRNFIKSINNTKERVVKGELDQKKALYLIKDMERSVLESKYKDFLTTNDIEYNTLVSAIVRETEDHNATINKKIAEMEKE